jgi:hypothetical protein
MIAYRRHPGDIKKRFSLLKLHLTASNKCAKIFQKHQFEPWRRTKMARRIKKPAVRPELRREWLRRHEEEGQSPPEIAKADRYDVRTVRKQIEIERQERERREARSIVLRQALEKHYTDLCSFAQRLDSHITGETGSLWMLRDDPMWSALREHMPRWKVWRNLARWERLQEEVGQLDSRLEKQFEELVKARARLKFSAVPEETRLNPGITQAVAYHFKLTAQGQEGLGERADFELEAPDKRTTQVRLGPFTIGRVSHDQVTDTENLVTDLLAEVTTWNEHDKLIRLFAEINRVQRELHDELLVVILRRVVPGRCKFCPI